MTHPPPGTDVSKEAAKMVLADDNFTSIVAAVKEGRRVWDNIVRLLLFNLPVNIAQGISVLWAYILGFNEAPLSVLQVGGGVGRGGWDGGGVAFRDVWFFWVGRILLNCCC